MIQPTPAIVPTPGSARCECPYTKEVEVASSRCVIRATSSFSSVEHTRIWLKDAIGVVTSPSFSLRVCRSVTSITQSANADSGGCQENPEQAGLIRDSTVGSPVGGYGFVSAKVKSPLRHRTLPPAAEAGG